MWLGIETSSVVSSVAVMNESQLLGEITIQAGLTHSEQLVPHIQALLEMTRVEKSDLKGIVVASGPGSLRDCVLVWERQRLWRMHYIYLYTAL